MDQVLNRKLLLSMSIPLAVFMGFTSAIGLLFPEIYYGTTPNWELQTIGQDAVDLLLILPVLVVSSIYARNGGRLPSSVWAGTNIYIVYTFVIYCFDVKFNALFMLYCFILGLASFSTAAFLYKTVKEGDMLQATSVARKFTGYFFIVLSVLFYFTWLSDIVPAVIEGRKPAALLDTGLFTNPVHVLDLSIILPLVFVVGVLTLKGNSFALALAPALLVFFVLMDITIAVLAVMLFRGGMAETYSVSIIMGVHAALSIGVIALLWNKTVVIKNSRVWNLN